MRISDWSSDVCSSDLVCRRSRQSQAGRSLRLAEPGDPAIYRTRDGTGAGGRCPGYGLRRNGRAAAGGDGADRAWDHAVVDYPGGDRTGEIDGALAEAEAAHGAKGALAERSAQRERK